MERPNRGLLWKKCLSILKRWNQEAFGKWFGMTLRIPAQERASLHIAANCIEHFWNNAQLVGVRGLQESTMSEQRTVHTLKPYNKAFLIIPILIALWFLNSFAFQYLTLERDRFGIYWPRHQWLYVHILAGALALFLGPIEFWLGLSRREKLLHPLSVGAYTLAVFTSGGAALYLARHTYFGWVFGMGMTGMSLAWMISTSFAALAISLHLTEQHREWMIRSYVLTFGCVTLRVFVQVLQVAGIGTMFVQMSAASWFSWSVPLLLTECVLQGRKIFATRHQWGSEIRLKRRERAQIGLFDRAAL